MKIQIEDILLILMIITLVIACAALLLSIAYFADFYLSENISTACAPL